MQSRQVTYYWNNREQILLKKNLRYKNQPSRVIVNNLKDNPCLDCGGLFPPECMDFDHVRGIKSKEISKLVKPGVSLDVIKEEISKCDLVCSNCHRIRTAQRKKENAVQN